MGRGSSVATAVLVVLALLACKERKPTKALAAPQPTAGGAEYLARGGKTYSLAVSRDHIFWSDANTGAIHRQPKGGGPSTELYRRKRALQFKLHVDGAHLYWSQDADGRDHDAIMRVPLNGGNAEQIAPGAATCMAFPGGPELYWAASHDGPDEEDLEEGDYHAARHRVHPRHVSKKPGGKGGGGEGFYECVTTDGSAIYYTGRDQGALAFGPLSGNEGNSLYKYVPTAPKPHLLANGDCKAMAADARDVLCLTRNRLLMVPTQGGAAQVLWRKGSDDLNLKGAATVALTPRFAYFGSGEGHLYRVPRTGGAVEMIWNGGATQLAHDDAYIYWAVRAGGILRRRL